MTEQGKNITTARRADVGKALATRAGFRENLENIAKEIDSNVDRVTIEWDEEDTIFMTSAKTVTIYYKNGYSKNVNVECCSFRAIAMVVIKKV
jgi:hypothetical protein